MAEKITIIGSGPGGYWAAVRASQMGAEVTIIEAEKAGGACLHWGCIPSKIMIHTSRMLDGCLRGSEFGISLPGKPRLDMGRLMTRKTTILESISESILKLLSHHHIRYVNGHADLVENGMVWVKGSREEKIFWDRLIVASGSMPATLPALPVDGKRVLSSDLALDLTEIPESILIVGGGVIGCEFAFILSLLGSKVTVVEALSRLLPIPSVETEASKTIEREMKKKKIQIHLNRIVTSLKQENGKVQVTLEPYSVIKGTENGTRQPIRIEAEKVLVCVGRKPKADLIGVENLGIKTDEKGWVAVNGRMETSVPNIFAVGDILGPSRPMLAHVASSEGLVAAENAAGGAKSMDYSAVPTAIFTTPEVACVGMTEVQAKEKGFDARSDSSLFRSIGKVHVIGEISGYAKIVSDRKTRKILGMHLVGPHATDLIAQGALAVRAGLTVDFFAETIFAHPTLSEVLLEVALKACDRPLHG